MRASLASTGALVFCAVLAFAWLASPAEPIGTERPRYTPIPRVEESELEPPRRPRRIVGMFIIPIAGMDLPRAEELLPSAARDYRAGFHEGIDFSAPAGTPVLAAASGVIVRIDHDFTDWRLEERAAALAEARALGATPQTTLDRIRGRQVWVDHGRRIATRYAHLDSVAPLTLGAHVEAGMPIGTVGSSGLPEGGPHLHFEIRVDDGFYGDDVPPTDLARVLSRAFR
jgi:hypothetical protein